MGVEIWKMTDIGKEFLYHIQGSICENLKNEAAPWYPMIQSMKIYDCPIATVSFLYVVVFKIRVTILIMFRNSRFVCNAAGCVRDVPNVMIQYK